MEGAELQFLLTGGVALGEDYGDPPAEWVTDKAWGEINRLAGINACKAFLPHFVKNVELYY